MANQNIHQGDLNDHSIHPTWGTIEKQDDTNKEDRFIAIVESISRTVANKSNIGHIHDDRYYTEEEIDAIIAGIDSDVNKYEEDISDLRNDINSVYNVVNEKLPLSGGTMTGQIVLAENGYKTANSLHGYEVDQYGNFTHISDTDTDYFHFNSNDGSAKLSVYWETGEVGVTGPLTFATNNKNAIVYQGSQARLNMIRFIDNTGDAYGNGISIGGGGLTIIGGGESAENAQSAFGQGGAEELILCNDGNINIWTNCQNGHASATKRVIDVNGNFSGNAANVTGIVAIDHGGTNANNANQGRINLNAASRTQYPDDVSGSTVTRNRVFCSTNSGSAVRWYPLFRFPKYNDGSNFSSVIITGRMGGWNNSNMASVYAYISNRDSITMCLEMLGGATVSSSASVYDRVNLYIYRDSSSNDTLYLRCNGYFIFDIDIEMIQGSYLFNNSYTTTTPSGTEVGRASTSKQRMELMQGKLYVNGAQV